MEGVRYLVFAFCFWSLSFVFRISPPVDAGRDLGLGSLGKGRDGVLCMFETETHPLEMGHDLGRCSPGRSCLVVFSLFWRINPPT